MYTCGFRINANLLKEGSFCINAKLAKEEISKLHKAKSDGPNQFCQPDMRQVLETNTFKEAAPGSSQHQATCV